MKRRGRVKEVFEDVKHSKKLLALLLAATIATGSFTSALAMTEQDVKDSAESTVLTEVTDETEREILFNDDWKFYLGDPSNASDKNFDDSSWRNLTLPHDWSIELDFTNGSATTSEIGHLAGGTGWYRKAFVLPEEMAGKRINIEFGGVYMNSTTYVNGNLIGNYPNGYLEFTYDITDALICDGKTENVIAVRAENRTESSGKTSRWYSGSGIYRNVNLIVTEPVHLAKYGTKITTPNLEKDYDVSGFTTDVNIATKVQNDSDAEQTVQVRTSILNYEDDSVFTEAETSEEITVAAGKTQTVEQTLEAVNPELWSVDSPNLYKALTEILVDGVVTDRYESRFGFRWTTVTNNEGFYLNGEWMKLKGMCMHHDQGSLGSAAYYRAIERQMQILKGMGVNAIRVTHNPAADELLEICDKLGLMVIEEAFDGWYDGKNMYDYAKRFFEKTATHPDAKAGQTWAEFDLQTMIDRGKNFPGIIMWSIGNEIWETNSAKGVTTATNLLKVGKEIDDTRPYTMGEDKFRDSKDTGYYTQVADQLDVVGMNYVDHGPSYYEIRHEQFPDWIICGMENSSATKSRGVYAHPDSQGSGDSGSHPDYQQSSYDNDHVGWGSTATQSWVTNRDRKYVLGEFVWTGFDYIGEPTPWNQNAYAPPKNSYFGVVDTAGFVKDDYYLYQSQWTSVEDNPMVHIMPHWNWEDASLASKVTVNGKIPVRIYSNARSVELFKDGESLGKQTFKTIAPYQDENGDDVVYQVNPDSDSKLYLEWRIPYEPGTLTAVAYDVDGNEVAKDVVATADSPAAIKLSADRQVIKADGYDLSYITVDVTDANGNFMPTADNQMYFDITGDGEIVGVDNGNAPSWERYKDYDGVWKRKAFSGKALVIVKSTKDEGSFTLTATGDGLPSSDKITCYTTADIEDGSRILGYDAPTSVTTNVAEQPALPETVTAIYSDGDKEEVSVEWNTVSDEDLAQPGSFVVSGTVDGGEAIEITVIVKGVLGVKDTRLVAKTGTIPTLPATVKVVYSDGTEQSAAVTWDAITADEVAEAGTIVKEGVVEGLTSFKAKAYVRVGSRVVLNSNVAARPAGATYPKANASFNVGTGHNMSDSINDGVVAFNPSWNNWQNGGVGAENSWVSVEFEEAYNTNKVGVHFFTDGQTKEPRELIVQYSNNGTDWTNVENQSKTTGFNVTQGDVTTEYTITFDAVDAKYFRLAMKGQVKDASSFKPVGISEFKVYADITDAPVPSSNATLTALQLNGKDLEGFTPDTFAYTYTLGFTEEIPEITAVAAENASAFVIPAMSGDDAAVVSVTAEDGTTNRYTIQFTRSTAMIHEAVIAADKATFAENELVPFTLTAKMEDGTVLDNKDLNVTYDVKAIDAEAKGWIKVNSNMQIEAHSAGMVELTAEVTYRGKSISSNTLTLTITEGAPIVVTAYDAVTVTTKKNEAPVLPEKIKAYVENSFARELSVTWDSIDPSKYAGFGQFTVEGTVEGQSLKPTATVIVKDAVAARQFSTATPYAVVPQLPETVTVYNSDGTSTTDVAVVWDDVSAAAFKVEEGTIVPVNGTATVDGTELPVVANVRVTKTEVTQSANFALMRNGYELPFAIASYTNDVPESTDRVDKLNDGIVSFATTDADGKNIWCDWQRGAGGTENWIGVIMANEGVVTKRFVDTLNVGFYDEGTGGGTQKPSDYRVEYYTGPIDFELPAGPSTGLGPNNPRGHIRDNYPDSPLNNEDNWTEVTYIDGKPSVKTGALTEVSFEPVETCILRVYMIPTGTVCLGATELQFFGKIATAKSNYEVTAIHVGDQEIPLFPGMMDYEIKLPSAEVPTVTATATNNASVTVVPATDANGKAQIIVVPEDGSVANIKTYTIQFSSDVVEPTYSVQVAPVEGATVSSNVQQAKEGDTVTVSIADIASGKRFADIHVTDEKGHSLEVAEVVKGEQYTFAMPASAVTVTVTLEDTDPTGKHVLRANYSGKDVSLWINGEQQKFADNIGYYMVKLEAGAPIALTFKPRHDGREFREVTLNGEAQTLLGTKEFLYTGTMDAADTILDFTFDVVYKSLLKIVIDAAQAEVDNGNADKVIPTVKEKFEARFTAARTVYADENATQEQIDAATYDLTVILHYMMFRPGSKEDLKKMIDDAKAIDFSNFLPEGKPAVEAALAKAEAVYADPDALQGDIDDASEALFDAMMALQRPADRETLDRLIEEADAVAADLDKYVPAGQTEFLAALAEAKKLTETATSDEIKKAVDTLTLAMAELRKKADKSELEALLESVETLKAGDYTPESFARLAKAIADGQAVMKNENLSDRDQAIVTNSINEINTAKALLVPVNQTSKPSGSGSSSSGGSSSGNAYGGTGTAVVTSPVVAAGQDVLAAASVRSDTTLPFTLKRGSAYCFKMTVVNGNEGTVPNFTVGNGGVLKTQYVTKIGNDYYYRVWAIGKPGQSTGVYTALPGQNPQKHCVVTIG